MNKKSLLVVISGPSGVGKDVIIEEMINQNPKDYHFTITATTRNPRENEKNGINHYFLSIKEFTLMIENNELLEWAKVYGNYYGVPKKQVNEALQAGNHVIIRVDVQGAKRIKVVMPQAILIFVHPPNMEILKNHLITRGVNSDNDISLRLSEAKKEIPQSSFFEYSIINQEDRLLETVEEIYKIISKESLL
ncbi:MAG: guanylate kinase [Dehalococcoidia bacterium]